MKPSAEMQKIEADAVSRAEALGHRLRPFAHKRASGFPGGSTKCRDCDFAVAYFIDTDGDKHRVNLWDSTTTGRV